MNFETLQEVVDQWIRGHGRYRDKFEILARLTEDLGENVNGLRLGDRVNGVMEKYQTSTSTEW